MALSARPKVSTTYSPMTSATEPTSRKRREIHLTIGNLVALWVVTAALMVVVFFFGLHAGLEQGLKTALEEQSVASVRLPLALPSNVVNGPMLAKTEQNGAPSLDSARGLFAADGMHPSAVQSVPSETFDFSQSSAAPERSSEKLIEKPEVLAKNEAPLGFASKSAMDMVQTQATTDVPAPAIASSGKSAATVKTPPEDLVARVENPPAPSKNEAQSKIEPAEPARGENVKTSDNTSKADTTAKLATTKVASNEKKSRVEKGFYVQVAAPRSQSEAASMMKKVMRLGIPARVQETKVGSASYFRVIAGPRKNRAEADSLKKKLMAKGPGNKQSFVKYIDE